METAAMTCGTGRVSNVYTYRMLKFDMEYLLKLVRLWLDFPQLELLERQGGYGLLLSIYLFATFVLLIFPGLALNNCKQSEIAAMY